MSFLGIDNYTTKNANESFNCIAKSPSDGFCFSLISKNDVFLAVLHFKSQARGVIPSQVSKVVNPTPPKFAEIFFTYFSPQKMTLKKCSAPHIV